MPNRRDTRTHRIAPFPSYDLEWRAHDAPICPRDKYVSSLWAAFGANLPTAGATMRRLAEVQAKGMSRLSSWGTSKGKKKKKKALLDSL